MRSRIGHTNLIVYLIVEAVIDDVFATVFGHAPSPEDDLDLKYAKITLAIRALRGMQR